jgi:predicted metal-dependent hydrolase
VQLDFFGLFRRRPVPRERACVSVAGRDVPIEFVRHRGARRYVLRMRPDGSARVTVPRGGSQAEALAFAQRQHAWIEGQLSKPPPARRATWTHGTTILFRGEIATLTLAAGESEIRFADQTLRIADAASRPCLRPEIERHLRRLAARELLPRVLELAAAHQLRIARVTVRDQRSRWGSCSARATISLNWRLIQTPPFVRDYIIIHELMHLHEMNHSARFWRRVEAACPNFREAETWLKKHNSLLG